MQEVKITPEIIEEHGLSSEEYALIQKHLGRDPNITELGIYSVMWSEHCSYKNSLRLLKTLPTQGKGIMSAAGEENAGVIDIGDGLAVSFKIESHNHPSAVEPYQGAATGVGGILRDIFTMGARPIASLNSLRFGDLQENRVKFLLEKVVEGIADYGNCFGVPTVAGEIFFDASYQGNPLVNAMAVGILKHDGLMTAMAKPGNPVFVVGSSTGRDGIHGATFASVEISEESEEKRTSVQVGDPFMEKLLLEATLEVIAANVAVGIQDMGAAGLTSSSSEMSARGDCGMRLNLDLVPTREPNMTAYEIMLSESQERMLVVGKKGKEQEIQDIFEKWDLNCVEVGEVIEEDMLELYQHGKLQAAIPPSTLAAGSGAPVYVRETKEPAYIQEKKQFNTQNVQQPTNLTTVLQNLLKSPNIASKRYVYRQYDHMVQTSTMQAPGGDAAVLQIKGTDKALAMCTDCNGRYMYLDAYEGAKGAVIEAARNIACTGAMPLAITNCLNFGNPYDPEVYWSFEQAIRGMSDACIALETPVTGGNVSFYNESPKSAVYPTPVIGMVGLLENRSKMVTSAFQQDGDSIYLLGALPDDIGGSEYLYLQEKTVAGKVPSADLENAKILIQTLTQLAEKQIIQSAHDCAEGGLAVAVAESCFPKKLGAKLTFDIHCREDFALFGEAHNNVIVSCSLNQEQDLVALCQKTNQAYIKLGKVTGSQLQINANIDVSITALAEDYETALEKALHN